MYGGFRETECPRCAREVDLPLGMLCRVCLAAVDRRARRVARWVSLGTTAVFALYVMARLPVERTARLVGAGAIGVWFVASRVLALRVARQWFLR